MPDSGTEHQPDAVPDRRFRDIVLRMLESRDLDRARMSRFLHDEVAQLLSAAGLQLEILRMDVEERIPGIGSRTREIQTILDEIVMQVRDLSDDLSHEMVARTGLQSALDRLIGLQRQSFAGKIRLLYDSSVRVPAHIGTALFRVVEQALDNAVRHSGAGRIEVIFKMTARGPCAEVRDDGCGFEPGNVRKSPHGLGIMIMDHYAGKAGLTLEIGRQHGPGSTVRVIAEQPRSAGDSEDSNISASQP